MEGFDPIFPDVLALQNPLSWDSNTAFKEDGHLYAIQLRNGLWSSSNLVSVTKWIKTWTGGADADSHYGFLARNQSFNLNKTFYNNRGSYPDAMYDKIERADWEAMDRCCAVKATDPGFDAFRMHQRESASTVAREFGSRLAKLVRFPEAHRGDADLRAKMDAWKSSPHKTSETFARVFGANEIRVLPFPPCMEAQDVQAMWPKFGTKIHREIEYYLNGIDEEQSVGMRGTLDWAQFLSFERTHLRANGQVPFRTELTMSVPELMLCGQADFIAKGPNGEMILYDWKRTSQVKAGKGGVPMDPPWSHRCRTKLDEYTIQLNLYRYMLGRAGIKIAKMYLVCLHRDFKKKYVLIEVKVFGIEDNTEDGAALRASLQQRADEVQSLRDADEADARAAEEAESAYFASQRASALDAEDLKALEAVRAYRALMDGGESKRSRSGAA